MTKLNKFRFYFSPFFLMKFYMIQDIKKIAGRYNFNGNLIDIGCGEKPYKHLFKKINSYRGIDFKDYSVNKDFFGEKPDEFFAENYLKKLELPFEDCSFEAVVSFQVLEHHPYPAKLISEILRITKKNGLILISFPLIGGLHEKPNDFFRFTEYSIKEYLKTGEGEILEIIRQGSLFSTLSLLMNEWINNFAGKSSFRYCLSLIFYPLFLLFQYLSLILDKIFPSREIFFNYLILIKKC